MLTRAAPLIVSIGVLLAGCSDVDVSAETHGWVCKPGECTVKFTLSNETAVVQTVSYTLRAHRVESVMPGEAARRDVVVGEVLGEEELAGAQSRHFTQTLPVKARPSQIVVRVRAKPLARFSYDDGDTSMKRK